MRKQLQEQLAEAQKELDEAYYDREIETAQKGLDKTLEDFIKDKEDEMDKLDESLLDEDQIIADSFEKALANSEAIKKKLDEIAKKYGIDLEDSVTKPWEGDSPLGKYDSETGILDADASGYIDAIEAIREELIKLQEEADRTADSIIDGIYSKADNTTSAKKKPGKPAKPAIKPGKPSGSPPVQDTNYSKGDTIMVNPDAKNFSRDGGNGTHMQSWVPGGTFTVMGKSKDGNEILIGKGGGYTGWVKKSDIKKKHAKGVTNLKADELAWIDENGLEEIVMHAENGRLSYLTKGSSVLPNNVSENLMDIGADPTTWLENNRVSTVPSNISTTNNIIDVSFGSLVNIEHADKDSIPEIQDAVKKQLDTYMKGLNSKIKNYSR